MRDKRGQEKCGGRSHPQQIMQRDLEFPKKVNRRWINAQHSEYRKGFHVRQTQIMWKKCVSQAKDYGYYCYY